MSLLDSAMEQFVKMEKATTSDGYGSFSSSYTEGETFLAAVVLDASTEARIAAVQGLKDVYTITTSRETTLNFHDVIKRLSDNKLFRITTDATKTPPSAFLDMRQVKAEVVESEQS